MPPVPRRADFDPVNLLAHSGEINPRFIVHSHFIILPACGFRVGQQDPRVEARQALVFDDPIELEACNDSGERHALLIFDPANPALSAAERGPVAGLTIDVRDHCRAGFRHSRCGTATSDGHDALLCHNSHRWTAARMPLEPWIPAKTELPGSHNGLSERYQALV